MFCREHRKKTTYVPSGSGSTPVARDWDMYKHMLFLLPFIQHRRTKSSFLNKSPESVNPRPSTSTFGHSSSPLWVQEMFVEEDPDDTSFDYVETTSSSSTPTSVETVNNKEKKRFAVSPPEDSFSKKRNTVTDKLEKGMAEANAAFIQAVTNLESMKSEDPYTMCINESLKRVPINKKNRCIIEVLEVIDKYLEK